MKCEEEKTYAEEGSCPVCKMDLKEVEVASNEEAKEEEGVE
jgi:protein SCO1/2